MTSLLEIIDARIAELRTEADKQEPDSGKWFRLHKTADELVKVRQKVVEIAKDLEGLVKVTDRPGYFAQHNAYRRALTELIGYKDG